MHRFTRQLVVVVVVLVAAGAAQARPQFVSLFPNGSKIDGRGCQNCHNSPEGGDARNAFGLAMDRSSFSWSTVCATDSDGDGQTNGQELGDPECVWTSGAGARGDAISNPGRSFSVSANPLGGSPDAALAVVPVCPASSSSIVTACLCDDGFGPSADGSACAPVDGVGDTWMCDASWLGDGSCDCGCGASDSDCGDATSASCEYNDCDFWQPTSGLQPDNNDVTQCQGGLVSSTPGGSIDGSCPTHSTEASSGACLCDDGFAVDGAHSSCGAPADDGAHDDVPGGCAQAGATTSTFGAALVLLAGLRRRRRVSVR